ncbi:Apple-like protein [Artemisia annua]|uniref:Apple-like protein n=1 Tax=Artemisia annua TaxID=35608 RepID=A0A2U1PAV1_ARTAN|nr:Apple-like protein [Artemisia annua]
MAELITSYSLTIGSQIDVKNHFVGSNANSLSKKSKSSHKNLYMVIGMPIAAGIVFCFFIFCCIRKKKGNRPKREVGYNLAASSKSLEGSFINNDIGENVDLHAFDMSTIVVWDLWKQDKPLTVVDSALGNSFDAREIILCMHVGILCVQESATDRPTMTEAFMLSNRDTKLPSPNQPAFIFRQLNCGKDSKSTSNSGGVGSVDNETITHVHAR